jgi:hypothetical protein
MFTNGQIFLIFFEHFPLPQAGSVANIPESLFQHRGINQLIVQKPVLGPTLRVAGTLIRAGAADKTEKFEGNVNQHAFVAFPNFHDHAF